MSTLYQDSTITLPETNIAPKMDGWNTEDGLFSGAMLVSGRVYPKVWANVYLIGKVSG